MMSSSMTLAVEGGGRHLQSFMVNRRSTRRGQHYATHSNELNASGGKIGENIAGQTTGDRRLWTWLARLARVGGPSWPNSS